MMACARTNRCTWSNPELTQTTSIAPRWVSVAFAVALGLAPALGSAASAAPDDVNGCYSTGDSVLHVTTADGELDGVIIAMRSAVYVEGEDVGVVGQPRTDLNNSDRALQARPLQGLDIMEAFAWKDDEWQGKTYDPDSGNTYTAKVWRGDDGSLMLRGYIGVPLFGRTASFAALRSDNQPEWLTQLPAACTGA